MLINTLTAKERKKGEGSLLSLSLSLSISDLCSLSPSISSSFLFFNDRIAPLSIARSLVRSFGLQPSMLRLFNSFSPNLTFEIRVSGA